MEQSVEDLAKVLRQGPAFLLLGQAYLRLESDVDPFLAELVRKYHPTSVGDAHYGSILGAIGQDSLETALAWMQERCYRIPLPSWLETVAAFPWSGVYTSAIDSVWPRAFRTEWREPQPVFEEKFRPSDPRNRSRLHCTFLFGCVSRSTETERPPLTRFEFLKRKQIAVALARRLPESVTPFGCLIIEGYLGSEDWLGPEDLVPIVDSLGAGQTHIFSATESLARDPFVRELVAMGKLVLHAEGLAAVLVRASESGLLKLGRPEEEDEHGRRLQLGDQIRRIPAQLWNQVSRSATILDDGVLVPGGGLSPEARYQGLRAFLSESSSRPPWSGYQRGYAFSRDFEKELRSQVSKSIERKVLPDEPIILHGQTGTGKTVALGSLAYATRQGRKYPVLFIERRSQRPYESDIDAFCEWTEVSGAPATLVVWDGMVDIDQYYDLLRYLLGRGRKVVLVGSTYRLGKGDAKKHCCVEAPAMLTKNERATLPQFLSSFDPSLASLVAERPERLDASYLVTLYRLLPPTRALIRTGVAREAGYAEQEIKRRAGEIMPEFASAYVLAFALMDAGLITQEQFLSTKEEEVGDEAADEPQRVIDLVMVPGQFGLKVPFELLLRALKKDVFANFGELFSKIDILRWEEDEAGNIVVAPRHPLEAKLLVQARFGGAKTEAAFAKQLILELDAYGSSDGPEIQFAVDLVHSMGPNGPSPTYYARHFRELSDALRCLREERGILNPRLILQEASLLREWVKRNQALDSESTTEALLINAEDVLRSAMELALNEHNRKLQSGLAVELASALGTRAHHILQNRERTEEAVAIFQQVRDLMLKARATDPENYHALDVLAWTTNDILESDLLDPRTRAETEADILSAFEMAEVGRFDVLQRENYQRRRMQIATRLGNLEVSDSAFAALAAQGSCAGYYLRASSIAGTLPYDAELSTVEHARCVEAVDYLEEHRNAIVNDGRCNYLLLRLWWMAHAGRPLFCSERETVPFTQADWQHCLGLLTDLLRGDPVFVTPSLTYLRGLATFQLGYVDEAISIFRELERQSDDIHGRQRIMRHYLLSTPDGKPQEFNGTVRWVAGNKGQLYVEELRRNIRFIPFDFRRPDIRQHEAVTGFYLAFNYLGPIADPPGYLLRAQLRERT